MMPKLASRHRGAARVAGIGALQRVWFQGRKLPLNPHSTTGGEWRCRAGIRAAAPGCRLPRPDQPFTPE